MDPQTDVVEEGFQIDGAIVPTGPMAMFPQERHYRIPRVVDPKSSVGIFELPGGILHEGQLLREMHITELDGEDEDVLVSDASLYALRMNAVLARKIVRLGHVEDPATIGRLVPLMRVLDRGTALIAIRRVTHGDVIYGLEVECPHCGQKTTASPDLSSVTYFRPADCERLEWEYMLPKASRKAGHDVVVKWHVYDGERELLMSKVGKQIGDKDMLTWRIMGRMMEYDGKPMELTGEHFGKDGRIVQNKGLVELYRTVKLMSQADRNSLRNEFRRVEGDIDLEVGAKCPNPICGREFPFSIDITDRSFFFPVETTPQSG